MPLIRCRFYTDAGEPLGTGCKRMGSGCEFVHPSEAAWDSAMPAPSRHQSSSNAGPGRGRGRGRGKSGGPLGNSSGSGGDRFSRTGAASATGTNSVGLGGRAWGNTSADADPWGAGASSNSGWGTAGDSASSGWGNVSPPTGPRKRNNSGQTSLWGDSSGNASAAAAPGWGESSSVPEEARTKPGASGSAQGDTLWGAPDISWGASSSSWGAPPTAWPTSSEWGSPASAWGVTGATSTTFPQEKEKASEKDPFGFKTSGDSGVGPSAQHGNGDVGAPSTSSANSWGISLPKPSAQDKGWGRESSSISMSPARSENLWTPNSPTTDRSETFERRGSDAHNKRTSFSHPSGLASTGDDAAVSPFASLLDPVGPSRRQSSALDDGSDTSKVGSSFSADKSSARYSWEEYVRLLERAVSHQHELAEGEILEDKLRHLQKSKQYYNSGPAAIDELNDLRLDHRKKVAESQKRLSSVLAKLSEFSSNKQPPIPSSGMDPVLNLSADDLQRYGEEVKMWIEAVRPQVEEIQERTSRSTPTTVVGEEAVQIPSKRKQDSDDDEVHALSKRMSELEALVCDLADYLQDLAASSRTIANDTIAERPLQTPFEDGEIASNKEAHYDPLELENELAKKVTELDEVKQQVKILQTKDHAWWREQCKLIEDNEKLKMRLTLLEQQQNEKRTQLGVEAIEIEQLREMMARLRPPSAPQPMPTIEDIVSQIENYMRPRLRQETIAGMTALRESTERYMKSQENALVSEILSSMRPTLRIVNSFQEFLDVQTSKGNVQVVATGQ